MTCSFAWQELREHKRDDDVGFGFKINKITPDIEPAGRASFSLLNTPEQIKDQAK